MAYSVNISVEAPIENQIQEITYDGQEIYQTPLSMSENLAKLAQKIDFSKNATDDVKKEETVDKTDDEGGTKDPATFQSSLWPWDSVRNQLRSALTEVCVLADVLTIAKEKRYMVLDPVQQDLIETKPMAQVYARKKALASAASVLLTGAERLRTSQNEAARNRTTPDFHIELLRLRQNWRLKKVSNSIIGDLSYRTAGSKYAQTGMFEVTKAEEEAASSTSPPPSPGVNPQSGKPSTALRVTVPSELQGVAYIEVLCQKDQEDLCSASINLLGSTSPSSNPDVHWQQRLEAAQNVLFCKELFNQLAKEAVQLQAAIPHMVVGNQIMATVLPGIQLIIGLCHGTGSDKKPTNAPPHQKAEHDHVLEHSLHQLLREVHHKNTHHPFPHPSSGPLGPSKRRCLAGPMAADRYQLLDMTKRLHVLEHSLHHLLTDVHHKNTHHPFPHPSSGPLGPSKRRCLAGPMAFDRHQLIEMTLSQTLLEQIIQQSQHFFQRLRTEYVLDTIAKEVKDPLIVSHWNALNSPTQSCVKINIVTHGYDTICRTSLVVHVGEKTLKCVCRDGRVMHMSYEPQELRDIIYCQIYQHQINAVQALAKCMGWQFLANSSHLGIGAVEMLGNASSCILASPIGDRMIAVRCEPQAGAQVAIAHSPRKDFYSGQLVKERKWENLGGAFKEVRWDKMEGKNFLNKMELLMASLTSS